jgi:hypothetical protein
MLRLLVVNAGADPLLTLLEGGHQTADQRLRRELECTL